MTTTDGAQPAVAPRAVEIPFAGSTARGQAWPGDANWVVLLHGPGEDLDAWTDVPGAIGADGYSVLAVDLPGHGLSDDPWTPNRIPEFVHALAGFAESEGARRIFMIAPGVIAALALLVPRINGVVALSPEPAPFPPPDQTPPALIFVGGADRQAVHRANAFFRQTRGWAVVSSFGTADQGTAIFQSEWRAHALEQTLAFLRDYRTP